MQNESDKRFDSSKHDAKGRRRENFVWLIWSLFQLKENPKTCCPITRHGGENAKWKRKQRILVRGDFSTILETQILSFSEVDWKKCCTHHGSYHSDLTANRFSHLISKGNYWWCSSWMLTCWLLSHLYSYWKWYLLCSGKWHAFGKKNKRTKS